MKPVLSMDRESIKFIAESLGLKVRGVRIYRKYPGLPVTCQACGKLLTTKTVGSFAKGKRFKVELYCENTACLASWVYSDKTGEMPSKKLS